MTWIALTPSCWQPRGVMVAAAVWVSTWVFPVTFMVLMAWSCERDARQMGWKALALYGGESATTEVAIAAARRRRDEGDNDRQLIRSAALALSVALPIAFIAIAIRFRTPVAP